TGRFAKTLGESEKEVSAWQGSVRQIGGSTESASSAIGGLNSELVRFTLTGQSSMTGILNQLEVGIFDRAGKLKTSTQLLLDIAEAIDKNPMLKGDPRRAAGLLSMIPGMNADMINLLVKGRGEVEKLLEANRKAGTTTEDSSKN